MISVRISLSYLIFPIIATFPQMIKRLFNSHKIYSTEIFCKRKFSPCSCKDMRCENKAKNTGRYPEYNNSRSLELFIIANVYSQQSEKL